MKASSITMIVLLGIIVAANFYYRVNDEHTIEITNKNCDLQKKSCTVNLADKANITFSISPKPISPLKQLTLSAQLGGISAHEVQVNIISTNMNMGILSYSLKNIGNGEFTGNGALGVCSVSKMQWVAKVNIKTKQENYLVNFPFSTVKN